VLVTGGAGLIGSHVTAELLRRDHAVRVLDNFSTGSRENLAAVGGDVQVIECGGGCPRRMAFSGLRPRATLWYAREARGNMGPFVEHSVPAR